MQSNATFRSRSRERRHTPSRALRETSCAVSNPNRRCRSDDWQCHSSRKTRYECGASPINFARRDHRTQQYSITALTDSVGTIQERYGYDAYGNLSIFDASGTARTTTAEGNRYTYTGREWDEELGLYHFRARMYDAVAGRFWGRDPLGYLDGCNMFRLGVSLHMTDPFGLWGEDCKEGDCTISRGRYSLEGFVIEFYTANGWEDFDFGEFDELEWEDIPEWLKKILRKTGRRIVRRGRRIIPSAQLSRLFIYGLRVRAQYSLTYDVRCCVSLCNYEWYKNFSDSFEHRRKVSTEHSFGNPGLQILPGSDIRTIRNRIKRALRLIKANYSPLSQEGARDLIESHALKNVNCCDRIVGGYDEGILSE